MSDEFERSDAEWRALLSPEAYRILRQKGTERAFTGEYYATKRAGTYLCAGCGQALFDARAKYDSGSGWPSFYEAIAPDRVATDSDTSHGMVRVEITCSRCGGHLGHVFEDGPRPTGLRFCVNSASLTLKPEDEPSR
jgi:peptide-methionine (R)-S-oxide reductase